MCYLSVYSKMTSLNPKVEFIYTILKTEYGKTDVSRESIQAIISIMSDFESGSRHSSLVSSQNSTSNTTSSPLTSSNDVDLLYKHEQKIRQLENDLKNEKETIEELRTSYIQLKRDSEKLRNLHQPISYL